MTCSAICDNDIVKLKFEGEQQFGGDNDLPCEIYTILLSQENPVNGNLNCSPPWDRPWFYSVCL